MSSFNILANWEKAYRKGDLAKPFANYKEDMIKMGTHYKQHFNLFSQMYT